MYNAEKPMVKNLFHYIESIKTSMMNDFARAYTFTEEENAQRAIDPTLYIELQDCELKRAELDTLSAELNVEQRTAYDSARNHISGVSGNQMIMFVSGEGGTGKSRIIESVTLYTRLHVGKTEGTWGPVLKTAPTGGAAHNIGGSTWHSALGKNMTTKLKLGSPLPDETIIALQRKAKATVLFVLDELSLVSCKDLYEISRRLGAATGNTSALFGGLHVLLAGDFYQMKTMNGTALVEIIADRHKEEARRGRSIISDSLTDFCMLIHNVRAQQSSGVLSPLAQFTRLARIGDVHEGDGAIAMLHMNNCVVNDIDAAMRKVHKNALWITATHAKVADINKRFKKTPSKSRANG